MRQGYKISELIKKGISIMISLYLFVMMGVFPLFYKYRYADMGEEKFKVFLLASILCVVVFFLFIFVKCIGGIDLFQIRISGLDIAVLIYFACTTISFLFTPFKEYALWGAAEWNMGYMSQCLFVLIYFVVAKFWKYQKWVLWVLGISSGIVFGIGVCHRFDVDLLSIYGDLELEYKILFLSTIGQSSWYSGFLCTVFPIGLYLFFVCRNIKVRLITGVYSVIAMCSLVTQNTDSAFLCLFATVIGLYYLSTLEDGQLYSYKRVWETTILILGSFSLMGLCQTMFKNRVIPLDSLSVFMSQSIVTWVLLAAVILLYLISKRYTGKLGTEWELVFVRKKRIRNVLLGLIGMGVVFVVAFIVLNTSGILNEIFGYYSANNYLFFDNEWGNRRGFAWKLTVNSFAEFSVSQKLFGIGPDCFAVHIESIPKYLERMEEFWGNLLLANAHNEYLTKLYTLGIAGVASYVGMLITGIVTFLKKRNENILLPAFALCIVSYMMHNVFCYEQVCCTPFLYMLLGIGSNMVNNRT